MKADLVRHSLVLVQDAALKNPEAFFYVAAQPQVHARLVIFDRLAAPQNPPDGDVQGNAKIETEVGPGGETVEIAHPSAAYAASHIACKGGVGVPVRADNRPRFHQREDVALHAVREIGGMNQAERRG